MNRLLSILLSFFDDIIPLFLPSKTGGFLSSILMIAANITPAIGVIFFRWNPFIILFIYWFESAIIGILNILKMLISGAVRDRGFSPGGFSMALFLSAFFTFHYGMFMFVHGIFLLVFYFMFTDFTLLDKVFEEFNFSGLFSGFMPQSFTATGIIESEIFPVIALCIYHLINFIIYFLLTGEYDKNSSEDYMMRPYKRIFIMQITIIIGAFAMFLSGFRSTAFIIVWIAAKITADLKLTAGELKIPVNALKEQ